MKPDRLLRIVLWLIFLLLLTLGATMVFMALRLAS